jgi:hypothetical protein
MTQENNSLIVEFMEIPKCGHICSDKCRTYKCSDGMHYQIKDMKFNTSWDWIMPVVEKIEDMGYNFQISEKGACLFNDNSESWIPMQRTNSTKLIAVYKLIIDFIKLQSTISHLS